MFICLECGSLFDKPMYYRESHGFDTPPYEEFEACPACGGAFAETYECDSCGEWITGDYAELNDGSRHCEECHCIKTIGEDD